MKGLKADNIHTCQNIMEILVNREVEKQLRKLPPNLASYIDPIEVATFALNRLPPLYASSAQGKQAQQRKGELELKNQITIAVRQAIAAVQRDPIRMSDPIPLETSPEYQIAQNALKELELILQRRNLIADPLTWQNLVVSVKNALRLYASNVLNRENQQQEQLEQPRPRQQPQLDEYDAYAEQMSEYDWTDIRYH